MALTEVRSIERGRVAIHSSFRYPQKKSKRTPADCITDEMVRNGWLPFRVKLNTRQAKGLLEFFNDMHWAWGSSGHLGPIDLDRAYGAGIGASMPDCPTDRAIRAQRALNRLRQHERALLMWLVKARERINVTLATLGIERAGVDEPNRAQGVATGLMQGFASSIAEIYEQSGAWT